MGVLDSAFLHSEDAVTRLHIGSLARFEGPAPTFEEVAELVAAKLHLLPRYRQRIRAVPGDWTRPVWSTTSTSISATTSATRPSRRRPPRRPWAPPGQGQAWMVGAAGPSASASARRSSGSPVRTPSRRRTAVMIRCASTTSEVLVRASS